MGLWPKDQREFGANSTVSMVPIPVIGGSVAVTVLEWCENKGILFYLVEPHTGARRGYADVDYVYFEKP